MGVPIFSDCIFFLKVNSLPLKERTKLSSIITSNGGEISLVLNEKCTHAVVSNAAALNSTQQKKIEKHTISIVNPDFIWKSVQDGCLIEVKYQDSDKPYEVTGDEEKVEKKNLFLAKFLTVNKKESLERNLEEDLEFEDNEDDDNIPDDTEVAKYSCFQKDEEYTIVELLCFNEQGPFPFRISIVRGLPNTSQKEFMFHLVDTAEKACEKYEQRVNDIKNKGFTQIHKIPLQAESLASKALQKLLLGEAINITELSSEVAGLVESIWVDAVGHLDSILSCPVENISLNDLSKAEGILRQVRNALTKKDKEEDIYQMMEEFYRFIPHKERRQNNINTRFLTVKQDLCQVIRDMVNVCETSLSRYTPTSTAKYQALRCRIEHIDPNSAEFHQIKQIVLDQNHSNRHFNILRVFRVGRLSEATNFKSDLGNVKSLLHASSPCNFVGILSRGLMLPKIIVEEYGGERTDIGNLGSGIYFSDSISTSVKYSQPSDVTGSRLLVVCDVSLGKCTDVYHRDYTITEPPNGFHSVHGVQRKDDVNSDFTDDEYVVYDVNQVQMRYVVQFSADGDNVDLQKESLFISIDQTPDHCKSPPEPSQDDSLEDLPDKPVTKAGLESSDGQQIPLQTIHVKARLMDLAAKVVMFQTYKNNSTFPIEAKYVFPLDGTAAVCGFEAFINGKHIIGEVKEKQQAHREYRAAISEGHGAYLMDQDAPDVFTVSVGNLPSKATVVIKITYIMELGYQWSNILFSIPGNVAQWQQDKALKEHTQDTVTKVGIESGMAPKGSFSLVVSIEMPRKIENICCYSHKIKIKKTECKAVIQTEESSSFNDDGFSMYVQLELAYIPRMWVEKHPEQDSEACMLIFQPDIQYSAVDTFLTICLDCSNSMESCFQNAKQVAWLVVQSMCCRYINIVLFGSNYKELYFYPKYNIESSEMQQFIKEAKPTMGSTEFWKVLQSLGLLRPKKGCQKVLLISDGHVQNEDLVFKMLKKNKNHIQLFTCGVGTTANKHMLRCFAQYGSGAFEYFADKSKSKWSDQIENVRKRIESSACTAVSVKWGRVNQNASDILQAPANIQALFYQDILFVYGFAPHCTQATLKALIDNEELENMVSTTELQKTTGTMLHTLTARALIKDYEDGILHEKDNENEMKKQEMKSFIIQLSKEYSIVTQFTSFVAVEKRSAAEDIDLEPNVLEIISAEDVDILPYMDWSSPDDDKKSDLIQPTAEDVEESEEILLNGILFDGALDECAPSDGDEEDDDMGFALFDSIPANYTEDQCLDLSRHRESFMKVHDYMGTECTTQGGGGGGLALDAVPEPQPEQVECRLPSLLFDSPILLPPTTMAAREVSMCVAAESKERSSPCVESFGLAQQNIAPLRSIERIPQMSMALPGWKMYGSVPRRTPSSSEEWSQSAESSLQSSEPAVQFPVAGGARPCSATFSFPALMEKTSRSSLFGSAVPQAPVPCGFGAPMQYSSSSSSNSGIFGVAQAQSLAFPPPSLAAVSSPGLMEKTSRSSLFGSAVPQAPVSRGFAFGEAMQYSSSSSSSFGGFGVAQAQSLAFPPPSLAAVSSPGLMEKTSSSSLFGSAVPQAPVSRGFAFGAAMQYSSSSSSNFGGFGVAQAQSLAFPPPSLARGPLSFQSQKVLLKAPPPPPPPLFPREDGLFRAAPPPPPPPPPCGGSLALSPRVEVLFEAPPPPPPPLFPREDGLFRAAPPPPCGGPPALFPRGGMLFKAPPLPPKSLLIPRQQVPVTAPPPPAPRLFLPLKRKVVPPSWSSLSSLQCQEGYWLLNQELGTLLKINVSYLAEDFLVKKGIRSLGARGIETIHKLIATLLVLQIIRTHNMLSGIKFKALMKLDQSVPKSSLYPTIGKAIEWAVKSEQQYPGICMRLKLGKDWDDATRQLLGLDPISTTSDLYSVHEDLFLL